MVRLCLVTVNMLIEAILSFHLIHSELVNIVLIFVFCRVLVVSLVREDAPDLLDLL